AYLGDDPANKVVAIAAGAFHSLALMADGTVYTWGHDGFGQLGDNSTTDKHTPVRVLKGAYNGTAYLGDDPANKITALSAGYYHTIALDQNGSVYTWGWNRYGQLGDGSWAQRNTPVRVLTGEYNGTTYLGDDPANKVTAITAGYYHTIALDQNGSVYTWGWNNNGQLGDGSNSDRNTPVRVLTGEYNGTTYLGDDPANKITKIAGGSYHVSAMAQNATVYTWGYNYYGQLGNYRTTNSNIPVKVHGEGNVGDLSLPVNLSSFSALAGTNKVTLKWATESEVENVGFEILRANDKDGDYQEISSYRSNSSLKGQYSTSHRTDYRYDDQLVQTGQTYWYKLIDV
ncbi:MAG: hypothetical protein D6706_00005, partial [Chloroflexi bacterium]